MGDIFRAYARHIYNPLPEDVPELAVEDLDLYELYEPQPKPQPIEDDPE